MQNDDVRWMRAALSVGARGAGRTWPNPSVGCVIVKNGVLLGRGFTQAGGRPHAETQALAQAGSAAQGATAYVTLEPCNHHGQTPPCSEALIAAGIARVVVALRDPDPRTDGGGLARLTEAGICVETDICGAEAARAHRGFVSRILKERPQVTLKLASSFDGRIATGSGESRWITGPQARRAVHAMRLRHDAVMVGGGTARADDPDLTVRDIGASHQPVRVILSHKLDLPSQGRLAASINHAPLWLLHGADAPAPARKAWAALGAELIEIATDSTSHLDVSAALHALGQKGLTSVFCEGGGALAASLLKHDLVDDLLGFTAGLALGSEGQPAIGALGLGQLSSAPRFQLRDSRAIGPDILHEWVRHRA